VLVTLLVAMRGGAAAGGLSVLLALLALVEHTGHCHQT
jgi:hypothetical protein